HGLNQWNGVAFASRIPAEDIEIGFSGMPSFGKEGKESVEEARALVQELRKQLKNKQKIGVVAFSEIQLNCIYAQLTGAEQAQLEQRIQDRSAFFLALEQVQGEECEILMISFGYAKNEAEQFSLKIGPMAQAQSSRRLNVLLTRAQKSLHFFSSIRAADFPIKRSAATNKLWGMVCFLRKLERPTECARCRRTLGFST
ncbi:MAG: hypothetical protein RJB25_1395, partial [Bacteroidota bacterium]